MSENLENRISSTQAKDAIFKIHSVQSSASALDGSVGYSLKTDTYYLNNINRVSKLAEKNSTKIVAELPEPSLVENQFFYLLGEPPILCYSDGIKWFDISNQTELTKWWLPKDAEIHVDFVNNRFYFNGEVKTIADLTSTVNGYTLNYSLVSNDLSLIIEYEKEKGLTPSGSIFTMTGGFPYGQRIELVPYNISESRYYINGVAAVGGYTYPNHKSKLNEDGLYQGNGNTRIVSVFSLGNNIIHQVNNGQKKTDSTSITTSPSITKIGFGCGVHTSSASSSPLTNATLKRVTIFKKKLNSTTIESLGKGSLHTPIHLVGDSFLNGYSVFDQLALNIKNKKYYLGMSQDNQGGQSLTAHSIRYANNDKKWYDSVLVIGEFGRDGTGEEFILALRDMLSRINTDKWLVLEPAPILETTQEEFDKFNKELISICGSRYVRTLAPAQALSNGSPEDTIEVNKGLWPLSLKVSTSNFHPNEKGYAFIGNLIYNKLIELGWIS